MARPKPEPTPEQNTLLRRALNYQEEYEDTKEMLVYDSNHYSEALIACKESGLSYSEIARQLGRHPNSVRNRIQVYQGEKTWRERK